MINDRIKANHRAYLERMRFYSKAGYELIQEREFILKCVEPISGDILEIGTGKGHFALVLAQRGLRFISIDLSAAEQETAGLNLKYYKLDELVDLRVMDAERLEFPDKSFDFLFSVNVFHHLKDPDRVLDEMIRVLKPGGRIVLSDFNSMGIRVINKCHDQEGKKHDHFLFDMRNAVNFLAGAGFEVTQKESRCQTVLTAYRRENILRSGEIEVR